MISLILAIIALAITALSLKRFYLIHGDALSARSESKKPNSVKETIKSTFSNENLSAQVERSNDGSVSSDFSKIKIEKDIGAFNTSNMQTIKFKSIKPEPRGGITLVPEKKDIQWASEKSRSKVTVYYSQVSFGDNITSSLTKDIVTIPDRKRLH